MAELAPSDDLRARLETHNSAFESLLRYIPAQFYIHKEEEEPLSKSQKQKRKRLATGEAKKEAAREAKRAKFDPDQPLSILGIHASRAQEAQALSQNTEKASTSASRPLDKKAIKETDEDGESDGDEGVGNDEGEDDGDDDEDSEKGGRPTEAGSGNKQKSVPAAAPLSKDPSSGNPNLSHDELQAKVQKRIAELQAARKKSVRPNATDSNADDDGKDNPAAAPTFTVDGVEDGGEAKSREELLEKRRKQREVKEMNKKRSKKQKPGQEADGAAAKVADKKGKAKAVVDVQGDISMTDVWEDDVQEIPEPTQTKSTASIKTKSQRAVSTASTTNNLEPDPSSLSFSNFDFSTSNGGSSTTNPGGKRKSKQVTQHNTLALTSKDPQAALSAISRRADFLEKLTPQARERAEEKDRWDKAGLRAEGEKVRDDVKKLNKMVKRKEKEKDKSKKAWTERKEEVASSMAARQEKRTQNIAARNQARKDKKMGIKPKKAAAGKKKVARPGFEGGRVGKKGKSGGGGGGGGGGGKGGRGEGSSSGMKRKRGD